MSVAFSIEKLVEQSNADVLRRGTTTRLMMGALPNEADIRAAGLLQHFNGQSVLVENFSGPGVRLLGHEISRQDARCIATATSLSIVTVDIFPLQFDFRIATTSNADVYAAAKFVNELDQADPCGTLFLTDTELACGDPEMLELGYRCCMPKHRRGSSIFAKIPPRSPLKIRAKEPVPLQDGLCGTSIEVIISI